MIDYYRSIGEATPLGMLIYSRDSLHPDPRTVERVADAVPTFDRVEVTVRVISGGCRRSCTG